MHWKKVIMASFSWQFATDTLQCLKKNWTKAYEKGHDVANEFKVKLINSHFSEYIAKYMNGNMLVWDRTIFILIML